MQNDILFTEKQKFRQFFLWLILFGFNALFIAGIYIQVIAGGQFGTKPMSNTWLFFGFGISIVISVIFMVVRLETIIKQDGIYVRFFPIQREYKQYAWTQINKLYIRKYSAIKDYGGWGLRMGRIGIGNALNVSGNKGLQIETVDNYKMLIGTHKPEELAEVLNRIGQIKQ
jgi:hypothetical protein